ncbi:MAG: HEAT repeat domain-containing protein [Phycisphaerae bacterium]|nr:HEAT repeat domain-containing protein [Phycisphaerae bacterium]MDW8260963.1 HEAT repeat domain-containing protein [Phycisphaerales bacterium]
MNRTINLLNLFVCGMVLAGCAVTPPPAGSESDRPRPRPALKNIPPPPKPPPVPPRQEVALDEKLRETARQQIVTSSQSSDIVLRCQAMEAAQIAGGPDAITVILRGLKDREPYVRFAAALAAGSLKLESARARLLELADDPDANVRVGVRYALHKLGDRRLSHDLEKLAMDPNPTVRRNTVMVLGLLGEPSAVKVLWPLKRDLDPAVRIQVAEALWRLGNETGLEDCVAACVSQYPDEQIIGVLALAAPRDARVRGHLRGKLTTPYEEVNLAAARALGMLGDDLGYGVALKGARSSDPRQRALAALAFGAIGRMDAQSILELLLRDSDESVRLAAAVGVLQLKSS